MHSTENQKNLVTISEKKMLKLDDEIKKEIEESIKREKIRARFELFSSATNEVVKKKTVKIESKIKEIRKIDPEFLVTLKRKSNQDKGIIKDDIVHLLGHGKSLSSMNLSPSESKITPNVSNVYDSRATPGSHKRFNPGSWYDSMKKQYKEHAKNHKIPSEDMTNYSSFAKEFVQDGLAMQNALCKAFRSKILIRPMSLYNLSFKKKL